MPLVVNLKGRRCHNNAPLYITIIIIINFISLHQYCTFRRREWPERVSGWAKQGEIKCPQKLNDDR